MHELAESAETELFEPLGITEYYWKHRCRPQSEPDSSR
jgi:hypothetical protein